ncbi:hypothetical protein ACTFBT_38380 [Streptomyces microflavus]|uniref:hypothetical protein n=1 Tax=Streptomyces TaxID=1883 RepID=UPI0029ACD4A5|nr:hypothetical protein [Streptomyces sp. NRRL_B-2249]MDX2981646.1 hypothetical protein [Streptomyces sp. NRRL_B-2249]
MHDERTGRTPESASAELRRRLEAGLVSARLNKSQLAGQAGLSRGTVQEAFKAGARVPSTFTVAALARVLKLPAAELQELRRDAAGGVSGEGPGRPIGQWEPHALEVHPAGHAPGGSRSVEQRVLPGYVRREHDRLLAEAVREAGQGGSRMLVLVGESSTGKTRACWEAVQPLAEKRWRLWHPFDPTRAEAALEELHDVGPRTVVWLNEAQHYLGDRAVGEQVAAAVHTLLTEPERAPVLVLGTLWPEYFKQYTALPAAGREDPHSRVRELLAGRTASVPDAFDASALAAAALLAAGGDGLLADALTRARVDGRLSQDLAGGPALLERYKNGSPAAKALLEAAMDARRLGVNLHLPQAFLTDAAVDYLHDSDWDQLTEDWAEKAYAELAEQVHGKQAPLRRVTPRPQRRPSKPSALAGSPTPRSRVPVFRLADYLEQHGATTRRHQCPPASFWNAAYIHITQPDDLDTLARAATNRHRLQWAHHLDQLGADHGGISALLRLATRREEVGDRKGAETLYQRAADHSEIFALYRLAEMREEAGDREGAETLAQRAADHGDINALLRLATMRETAGDRLRAEALARRAGEGFALFGLAAMREEAGDREGAETLAQRAADYGDTLALLRLAAMREGIGDRIGAESLYQRLAQHGDALALSRLAEMREKAGDREGAETLYERAADDGDTNALLRLAAMREEAGNWEGAEILYQRLADHDEVFALSRLAEMREKAGDRERAEALARRAGEGFALFGLAAMREEAGDREGAETLAQRAADHGDIDTLLRLAAMREEAGDREGARTLAQRAADHGSTARTLLLEVLQQLWPYGLDPDGTPTGPWSAVAEAVPQVSSSPQSAP